MIVTAGKSTRIALGLASALALVPIAGRAADAPANTCHLGKIAEVPVRVEDNRPEAQVTINGQTAWFIIDTGSTNTLMFGGAAQALKLNTVDANETEFYGVGGKQSARATQIASFKLGNAEAKNLRVYVVGKGRIG